MKMLGQNIGTYIIAVGVSFPTIIVAVYQTKYSAGISYAGKPGRPLEEVGKSGRPSVASLDEVRAVFETNVFGVIAVTQAMLPLLREAPAARIRDLCNTTQSRYVNLRLTSPSG